MKITGNMTAAQIREQQLAEAKARVSAGLGDVPLTFSAEDLARLIASYEASRVQLGAPTLTVN